MKKHLLAGVMVQLLLLLDFHGQAQERPIAFKGALIYPVTGPPIEKGILIVQKGRILAVGDATTSIPSDAEIIDATGKVIIPGIVDTHSHIGGPEGGDNSNALNPEVRVLDAVNPSSNSFKKALAGGITTANIMPGSGHLMSGQTIYLKMRQSQDIEGMLEINEKGVYGGMKMANGTNSMRGANGFPGTRAKSAAMDRELFVKAVEYKKKLDSAIAKKDSTKMPERDLRMESMVEVLEGRRIVHFHTHKMNDILTVLRLKKEFGFRVVLHHVSEAWKVIDAIAAAGVPCSIINIDAPGGKLEAMNLEKGKDADFVILTGDPFSVYTHVEQTWVEGLKRFDRSIPSDKAFAVGGYKIYTPEGAQEDDDKDYEWSDER